MIQAHNSQKPSNKTGVARKKLTPAQKERRDLRKWYVANEKFVHDVLLSLLADFRQAFPRVYGRADYTADCETVKHRLAKNGVSFATKSLRELSDGLLRHLEGFSPSFPSFQLQKGTNHPAFLRRLFAMAFNDKHKNHVDAVQFLYQFGNTFKKIRGPYRRKKLTQQLKEFIEVDASLPELPQPGSVDFDILLNARNIITSLIKHIDIYDTKSGFFPKPGPGCTNTPVAKNMRFRPHVLYKQIDDVLPYEKWFFPRESDVFERGVDPTRFMQMWCSAVESPTSRFAFVDKEFDKARGICMEESETMFFQQAIKNGLVQTIEEHPLTKGFVNFTLQEINQLLAFASSICRTHATLDMKEASDRILRLLVKFLFSGNPTLCDALMALSTRRIVFPKEYHEEVGTHIDVKKYAPMGSALCFPVMSLVHFALIKGIQRYYATILQKPQYDNHAVYVYGDDLVVANDVVGLVFKHLPRFGMKFNVNKSYHAGYFRESCGVHAYKGVNITPVYFKYKPSKRSTESMLSSLAVEADLFKKGYLLTAKYLRDCICTEYGPLPFVCGGSSVVGFIRNGYDIEPILRKGFKYRWNKEWQSYMVRVRVVKPLLESLPPFPEVDGLLRQYVTQAKNPGTAGSKFLKQACDGQLVRNSVVYKWVPLSACGNNAL